MYFLSDEVRKQQGEALNITMMVSDILYMCLMSFFIMKIKKQEPHIKMCGSCLCRLLFFLFVGLTNLACGRVYPRYFIRILALPLSLSLAILFSRICLTRSRVSPSWSPISSSPFS